MADRPQRPSRFATPSSQLDLNAISSRQLRKIRLISLAIAILLHGSLAIWKVSEVLGSIVMPATEVGLSAAFQRPELEPLIESGVVEAVKGTRGRLDMRLEMVDLKTLDYGQHRAAVVQDPNDKRRITGFFKIARLIVEGNVFNSSYEQMWTPVFSSTGAWIFSAVALNHLAEAINEFTDVQVEVLRDVRMGSMELFECRWAAVQAGTNPLRTQEARNLGEYVTAGGFLASDSEKYFAERAVYVDAFATKDLREGRHWSFVSLENDHPLFHAFYDMEGPPVGTYRGGPRRIGDAPFDGTGLNTETLKQSIKAQGVEYAGRLVGVLEVDMHRWRRYYFESTWAEGGGVPPDNRNDLKYGINLVIFALTQEGSLAARFVKSGG